MASDMFEREGGAASDATREALLQAVLKVSGARGHRALTVEEVAAVADTTPARFSALFTDLEDCYATAYEKWAGGFARNLLRSCRNHRNEAAGFRLAMEWMVGYTKAEPDTAKGAIGQSPLAGERVEAARQELLERLSHAVDNAGVESGSFHPSPPPVTASFVIGGIAWTVESTMRSSDAGSLAEQAPDLVFFAVLPFFGEEAAWNQRAAMKTRT